MFKIEDNNIFITRGDSGTSTLEITTDTGKPYEIQGDDSILLTVKKSCDDSAYLFQKNCVGGKFTISPTDTESLAFGDYVYDVQLKMVNGWTDTIVPPKLFRIKKEVTF